MLTYFLTTKMERETGHSHSLALETDLLFYFTNDFHFPHLIQKILSGLGGPSELWTCLTFKLLFWKAHTAWSKKNQAKFSDTCSVRADGLCIGCPRLVGRRKAANSNMLEFFCTTLYNPNCPSIYVHITWISHYGGLWGHSGLHITSEVISDLKFELNCLNRL